MIRVRAVLRHASTRGSLRALATTNDPANPTDSIPRRYETFYDDAVDAVDELRGTGTAPDGAPDAAATTEFIIVDPDTGVEVDEEETILMEDVAATSTSTSSSSSSSSGSDEGSDEDDGDAGADSEPRPKQTRAGIPADETAFADSSTAYKPAKPSVGYQAGNSKRESHSTASRQMAEAAAAQAPFTAVSARVDIVKAPHLPNILRHVTHLSTQDSAAAETGQAAATSRPNHDSPELNYDPSEAIAEEVLGVGAPVDSLQYKVEIERLDDDPIGPDPELLTDDADPPPELLYKIRNTAPKVEKVFGRI